MESRCLWIVESAPSAEGEALNDILSSTGTYTVERRSWLSQGAKRETSLTRPPSAVFVVQAEPAMKQLEGLPGRFHLPPDVPWFLVGLVGQPDEVLTALHQGFCDFLVPPLRKIEVLPRLWRQLEHRTAADPAVQSLKERLGLGHIVGRCPALLTELKKVPLMARCDASVLIAGETGTGKEALARAIHYLGLRSRNPFVAVNCGAIPTDLVENELFGHEAGAFTGATSARAGLVEEADGGTLFLDEVDSLSLSAQVKLLRLLQEKEFRHLGSRKTCRADVRVVASANTDLEAGLRLGKFRADLYYRLNVLPLRLPPLRERKEDLPLLARHFADKYAREFGRPMRVLTSGALARLARHAWPGNIRELENVIERAVLLTEGPDLSAEDLALDGSAAPTVIRVTLREEKARVVQRFEREYLADLMTRNEGNIGRAAVEAGKNRRALFELLRRHRMTARDFARATSPEAAVPR